MNLIESASSSFNYFYGYDGLGSVVALTDGVTGRASTVYSYDAWGNAVGNGSVGLKNKFRFTGEALDPGTQLYYLRARYYDPGQSRFMSKDSFPGFPFRPLSLHRFVYGLNRPTVLSDPSGLSAEITQPLNAPVYAVGGTTSLTNANSTIPSAPQMSRTPTAESTPPQTYTCYLQLQMPAGWSVFSDLLWFYKLFVFHEPGPPGGTPLLWPTTCGKA